MKLYEAIKYFEEHTSKWGESSLHRLTKQAVACLRTCNISLSSCLNGNFVNVKIIYDGKIIKLIERKVELSGQPFSMEIVYRSGLAH